MFHVSCAEHLAVHIVPWSWVRPHATFAADDSRRCSLVHGVMSQSPFRVLCVTNSRGPAPTCRLPSGGHVDQPRCAAWARQAESLPPPLTAPAAAITSHATFHLVANLDFMVNSFVVNCVHCIRCAAVRLDCLQTQFLKQLELLASAALQQQVRQARRLMQKQRQIFLNVLVFAVVHKLALCLLSWTALACCAALQASALLRKYAPTQQKQLHQEAFNIYHVYRYHAGVV